MLLAIPVILNSNYEQCMFKAMFLFAFSTFARIGELVAVRDIPQEHILQLSDVSLTSVQGEIKEAVVSFRKFKHNIKEITNVLISVSWIVPNIRVTAFASALPQQQRREVGLILELEKQVVGSPMLLENTYGPKPFMLIWFNFWGFLELKMCYLGGCIILRMLKLLAWASSLYMFFNSYKGTCLGRYLALVIFSQ